MTVHSHGCYNRLLLPRFVLEILGPTAARDGEGVASSAQPLAKHFPGSLLSLPRLLTLRKSYNLLELPLFSFWHARTGTWVLQVTAQLLLRSAQLFLRQIRPDRCGIKREDTTCA